MTRIHTFRYPTFLVFICALLPATFADESSGEQLAFVREKVLPLLQARCFECHKDPAAHKGGLLLVSRKSLLTGGDSGPAVVPGKPDESLLIEALKYESFEMPPNKQLPPAKIVEFAEWINKSF